MFRVRARNSVGYSGFSSTVNILAARIPDPPAAPTTEISSDAVLIDWSEPYSGGSPITGYQILIRKGDSTTFSEDLVNCDGKDATILANSQCLIPISVLRASPYLLAWGSGIYAKVTAINTYGNSAESSLGNGAIILTNPDAPLDLQINEPQTSGT